MSLVGLNEIILITAVLIALIVGPKKLPELARALGESKKELKNAMGEAEDASEELEEAAEEVKIKEE